MQGLQNIKYISLGHIIVSSVHNGGRNMLRNAFSFYIIIKKTLLKNVLNIHTQLQGIKSILKVVRIVNDRNKFKSTLQSYMISIIFLDIKPQSNAMAVNLMYRQLAMKTFVQKKIGIVRSFNKEILNDNKQKQFTGQCVSTKGRLFFPNKTNPYSRVPNNRPPPPHPPDC